MQHEESSSNSVPRDSIPSQEPESVQQSEMSTSSVSEKLPPTYKPTPEIVQWLAQVKPGEEDHRSPRNPSNTPPPSQQFVYKWVRRGAMLGIGGSGGWVPASYVKIRVPIEKAGTMLPGELVQQGQSRPPSPLRDASEYPRAQDGSSAPAAPRHLDADTQGMGDAGESTSHANSKPLR